MAYNPALEYRMAQKRKRQRKFQEESNHVYPEIKDKKESDDAWVERAIKEYERYPDSHGRNPNTGIAFPSIDR